MIFNSVTFLIFLIIVVSLYWVLPQKGRVYLLFVSSYLFYGFWRWEFLSLLIISTLVSYLAGIQINAVSKKSQKKFYLLLSFVINLGLLAYFKYLFFIIDNLNSAASLFGTDVSIPYFNIILPLGISFYTFQTLSYAIDVYRNTIMPERNFVVYATYISFFPQLVAGPILRAGQVIDQLKVKRIFDLGNLSIGLRRVLYGLFLKVVFADNIAPLVDDSFAQQINFLSAIDVWTMAFLFGLQIYFDFSAYSHIAIGSAKMLGISFPENFHYPYLAPSPKEFWNRWHISLSTWFRDYVFLPLAYPLSRKFSDKKYLGLRSDIIVYGSAILVTFLLCGLWHGANWTFVFWGFWHAVLLIAYRITSKMKLKISKNVKGVIGWMFTLSFSMLAWIPFRTHNLNDTFVMLGKVFTPSAYSFLGLRENTYLITGVLMLSVIISFFVSKKFNPWLQSRKIIYPVIETVQLVIIIILVFTFLRPINQFIYFQF
ncbi:MAG: MBOAT family protein [bacterium]|nr:MBOAT family protein [bacterium]